jgi:carboxypeptidase C (cathepsin A)
LKRREKMNKNRYSGSLGLLAVLFLFTSFSANGFTRQPNEFQDTIKKLSAGMPKAEQSITQHKITIGGVTIPYAATAGTFIVRNKKELPYASIGYTSYIRSDISDPSHRPITFAYNGGPGSCSIWLHMGALGPRRIVTNDTTYIPPPPFKITDNAYSILDKTDLVMIDPVGTGFSHAVGEAKDKDFWSVDTDIESIALFIRQYITENGRWNSPKYILGESYGTTRSAGVVDYLQSREYMSFNGVILVSMATDLELLFDDIPGYHWPSLFELPTYTAVAWYHKILPDPPVELTPLLNEVRTFAFQEYSIAITKGNSLPESERKTIIEKLHRYTGLSVEYLERADMLVTEPQFANELMRDRRKTIGSLDARFLGVNFDPLGKIIEYDPMDAAITPAFAAAFLDYLHRDLNFGQGKTYVLDADVWKIWDYRHKIADAWIAQPMVNTGLDLAHAMGFNPSLKVMVLQGIYDLGSPSLATEYMVSHLNLPNNLRSHIQIQYYDAGHMMYIHEPSLKKFKNDIATFIDGTSHQ